MARTRCEWRDAVRGYLTARLGQPVRLGDLLDATIDLVPLHNAARIWFGKRSRRDLSTPHAMRRLCVLNLLSHYGTISWPGEAPRQGVRLSDNAVLIPGGLACSHCGRGFVPMSPIKDNLCCSPRCGSLRGKQYARDQAAKAAAEVGATV